MSLSNEWFDYHLTPRGWEMGSNKTDFGKATQVDPPDDRVLTLHMTEKLSSRFSTPECTTQTTFRTDDESKLNALVDKFGESP